MAYNMSLLENGTNPMIDATNTINAALGGTFPLYFLLMFWLILIIGFKNYDTKVNIIASSTIVSLLSILFITMGWMTMSYIFIPAAMVFVGIMWKVLTD